MGVGNASASPGAPPPVIGVTAGVGGTMMGIAVGKRVGCSTGPPQPVSAISANNAPANNRRLWVRRRNDALLTIPYFTSMRLLRVQLIFFLARLSGYNGLYEP
jgi:hypothetical protein